MKNLAEEWTRRLLVDAGVREGMRVLDIGCGGGNVTFLAAELVGARGHVVGLDRDAAPLEAGRQRARELGVTHVDFVCADLGSPLEGHGPFDAVIGRRVLMYQPDAVACLTRLAAVLAPGGLIVLQEHDATAMPVCQPELPLHRQVSGWMWETVAREGADLRMGLHLAPALEKAGFTVERVRAEATVLTPTQSHPIGHILRAMRGRIVEKGVATEEELALDTIDARLAEELRTAHGTCLWEMVFGAWARKAG
ncbi:methyltransferase domain-containing protein [Archangium primigenium]|uniref:methyltransferase domain-containing protein n=1 Tax=[Archangium] primigenium TaxID=2792470 RepID=UPI00195AAB34|nr:class I SAM-dependent methyltransferase [Archangium primigenium]MBM7115570.1 class I SAM-dependent methyltransferase [Archangium primigenium]